MTPLVISHSVFLTKPELKKLMSGAATVETTGISVPTQPNLDVKLTELLCKYVVTSEGEGPKIELIDGGYKLYVGNAEDWSPVNESPEDTSWFFCEISKPITVNNVRFLGVHQVVIQDVDALERSTVCENLSRYLNKQKIA